MDYDNQAHFLASRLDVGCGGGLHVLDVVQG